MAHRRYNQWKAMLSVTKGSFLSILRNPSAVVFSLGFPFIFILVFGFIDGGGPSIRVALDPDCDTSNLVYKELASISSIHIVTDESQDDIQADVRKGRITAILDIRRSTDSAYPRYTIRTTTSAASADNFPFLQMALKNLDADVNDKVFPGRKPYAELTPAMYLPGRSYREIDFILPGMLGFSLLSTGVFGVAFLFYNLRQSLVLKRYFATPIRRPYIVFGETLSRTIFQLFAAVVIIAVGHWAFRFTLIHGWDTFCSMLLLSFLGLLVFMGLGFIVSSVANNETVIPIYANIITLPQFLLGGTFFPVTAFPPWLQHICDFLPLKQLNDALRRVAFEGASLWDVRTPIAYLLVWGIVIYIATVRVFKWED